MRDWSLRTRSPAPSTARKHNFTGGAAVPGATGRRVRVQVASRTQNRKTFAFHLPWRAFRGRLFQFHPIQSLVTRLQIDVSCLKPVDLENVGDDVRIGS